MPELPIIVTVDDAKNPTLLVRLLRTIADKISALGTRIDALVSSIKIPSVSSIRKDLQSDGAFPLNITNLRGIVADPQPASALRYNTAPTGLVLQSLRDTQFVLIKNGTGYDLCTVVGGNPNSLFTLISGAAGGTFMTTDTVQTVTGAKTFNAGALLLGGSGGTNQILKQSTAGGAITVGTIASTSLSDTANIPLLNTANTFTAVQTATNQPRSLAYNSAAQIITTSTITALTFDTNSGDVGSVHSTSSNTSRFTIPTNAGGVWMVVGQATFAANATGIRQVSIRKNGTTVLARQRSNTVAGGVLESIVNVSFIDTLATAADYYEILVFQDSGGNVDTSAGFGSTFGSAMKVW